jgi:hypothetical protein
MALFITGALVDALSDLASHPILDPLELLAELRKAEDSQYEQLLQAELPAMKNQIYFPGDNSAPDPTLDLDVLWKGPSLCRTARTPSQSRYLGYATNSEKVGGVAIVGSEEYDTGIPVVEARGATAAQGGVLVLAYAGDRESCSDTVVKPDYKDYFYANNLYGWATLSIPNEKERVAYGYNPLQVQGLVLLSFVSCDWGKCEQNELRPQDYEEDKFEIQVNGKVVSEMVNLGFEVWALKGEDGLYWKPDNSGVFVLSFMIKEGKGYVRISSVMLY